MGSKKDYGIKVGDKIGNWNILKTGITKKIKDSSRKNGFKNVQVFLCQCMCDNNTVTEVIASHLMGGKSNSCKKCVNKKYNKYDLSGECGIGYTSKGEEFYFDLEDYDKIKEYCWHMHWDTHNGYLRTCVDNVDGKHSYEFLHRMVSGNIPKDNVIDHINRKTFDNRKENLRKVSRSVNSMNCKRKNTKYISGVTFNKIEKKFKASIKVDKKQVNLGTYKELDDAIKARLDAEFKYFDFDIAPNRNLFEQYGVGCDG